MSSSERRYKLYMDFGTNISQVTVNPIGQFKFVKDGNIITPENAAEYFFITGDQRYFKLDRSTMGIRSMGAYLYSFNNFDVTAHNEFTLSFFTRIPRHIMNECTYFNFPLDGIRWDGGEILLYKEANEEQKDLYKGRYIHISCCGIEQDVVYNYQSYDGESYLHFAITLLDGVLRFFINGILYREAHVTNPTLNFTNMMVGNFNMISGPYKLDINRIPILIFDELTICDRCLWENSFIVPNKPLINIFPEVVDEKEIPVANALDGKINSAPNFYSRNKSYMDANLDRAEIVRPDAYKAPMHWKANMISKHKFNQDDYDYTAKSNWEHLYEHGMWPAGFPIIK